MSSELSDRSTRPHQGVSRRKALALGAGLMTVVASAGAPLAPQRTRAAQDQFAGVELPPEIGQTSLQVYVPETGHTIRGTMLDYWRANGAAAVFGNPISEPFAAGNGYYSQAFERGILQYHPEFTWSDEPIMRLMPIHEEIATSLAGSRRDGRRAGGGGNPRASAWRPVKPDSRAVARAIEGGGLYFEETGHTLSGEFLAWYEAHEGHYYLGRPVSQVFRDRGVRAQLFEGGLLRTTAAGTRLDPIDRRVLRRLRIDLTPVEQGDLPTYDEALFQTVPNPNPLGDLASPGRRWIEISLGQQQLWAYQGNTAVSSTIVSTGLDPNFTEQGLFHIRLKYPEQDMQGFTDSSGEVLGFGDAPEGTASYAVEDVPHVMYFNLDGEALHGKYWNDIFGTPSSHGCVNLTLDTAAFLYGWAPLGTMVWVHE